ncbi:type II toxin-antitoxin system HigB family toxin [Campylobacter hyointestinalis]|uniref:type II toxin-antitoxin system HigB family toxin n=1 Tax=Campylobacter hyointestinalis TaxID=198 RepID=UPI000723AF4B|nr:type II toxin-antitoxin system HigB family toxin [Campylobacter hyointestinalis]PPB57239.1 addiction module toxin RelE [Campylobacter hyointestinalis subsp. hyointestinalis]PPB67009.1 addiction module toxin RelE [Campylobacter hyointestinalis subsp. hyointestinalis]TWO20024.1 type II toxin-antitoxin system HigB family toxin [Campylobacter hyointestinalis]CUU86624.1 mRNA interferase HigB [Campylobacter hyointestinalis subsp. hyointestinalis]
MRIISRKTLKDFYEFADFKDSKESIEAWYGEALKANWNNPNEIKSQYKSASIIANNRVVFNLHGNKYRLIVKINYEAKIIFIRFLGTHKQYDKINAQEI